MKFDKKFLGFVAALLLVSVTAFASVTVYNGTTRVGEQRKIQCSTGLSCTESGGFGVVAVSGAQSVTTIAASGSTTYSTASAGPVLKQGANGRVGTFVCNGTTPVTVSNTSVAITDAIIISLNTVGGTVGAVPAVKTITASTGFTVAGTASDTSTYNYAIIKNAA